MKSILIIQHAKYFFAFSLLCISSTASAQFDSENAVRVGKSFEIPKLEAQPEIDAQTLRQGGSIFSGDYFGFSIDPYFDKRNGYAFCVNSNGVRWDALFKNITENIGFNSRLHWYQKAGREAFLCIQLWLARPR